MMQKLCVDPGQMSRGSCFIVFDANKVAQGAFVGLAASVKAGGHGGGNDLLSGVGAQCRGAVLVAHKALQTPCPRSAERRVGRDGRTWSAATAGEDAVARYCSSAV